MNRFESLRINERPVALALLHYEDHFYDEVLRQYGFKEALYLYLKRNGYKAVIFYSKDKGIHSFEEKMLRSFLDVNEGNSQPCVQTGQFNMPRMGQRSTGHFDLQSKPIGNEQNNRIVLLKQDKDGFWYDGRDNITRGAQMKQIKFNLLNRQQYVIVIEPSYDVPEFNKTNSVDQTQYLSDLVHCLNNERIKQNGNHFIVLANTDIITGYNVPRNLNPSNHDANRVQSSFWNNSIIQDHFIRSEKNENGIVCYSLKDIDKPYGPVWVLPCPTINDCKNAFQYWRIISGPTWNIKWNQVEDIILQISNVRGKEEEEQPKTLDEWEEVFKRMKSISYDAFDPKYGIQDRNGEKARRELNEMQGIDEIKNKFCSLCERLPRERINPKSKFRPHMAFLGSPGTGKTTVARLFARIMKDLGLLSVGHLVETSAGDFIAGFVGQTRSKAAAVCEKAKGGILFIDEAYGLYREHKPGANTQDFGLEAIDVIIRYMENYKNDMVFIFAGYEEETMYMINNGNSGLKSRIDEVGYYKFTPYPPEVLCSIAIRQINNEGWQTDDNFVIALRNIFRIKYALGQTKDGNVRFSEEIAGRIVHSANGKDKDKYLLSINDIPEKERKLVDPELLKQHEEEIYREMDRMVGQIEIKTSFRQLYESCLARMTMLLNNPNRVPEMPDLGYIFLGPSGTGKTSFARILARILYDLGLMPGRGGVYFHETTGTDIRNRIESASELLNSCLGKTLFIDEAYAMPSYFIDDLTGALQKIEYKNKLCIILAGYEDKMYDIMMNEGFANRFPNHFTLSNYTDEELAEILYRRQNDDFKLADGCRECAVAYFKETRQKKANEIIPTKKFKNAREVDVLQNELVESRTKRYNKASDDQKKDLEFMSLIIPEDFPNYQRYCAENGELS